jgi:cytochrome P450
MTSVQEVSAQTQDVPLYPIAKEARCPFDPPAQLREMREEAPLTRVRLWDGRTAWLVTRYAEQRELLRDPRVSADSTRPGYPQLVPLAPEPEDADDAAPSPRQGLSFITMDDPEHARLRRTVTAPFAVKRIEALRPAVQKIVDGQIAELLAGPNPADLVEAFALPVPSLVICALLGVPYSDHAFFQYNSRLLITRGTPPEQRLAARGNLYRYLDNLVGEKLVVPGDDLLSGLTARVRAGGLTRSEVAQMAVLLLVAGHETTANMIALGTLALLQHPEQLDALRDSDDPAAVAAAVEELLRYLNITHTGRRRVALADIEVGGQLVRAGEALIMANDVGNRDPAAFPDPDRLDLTREARHHVAFGFGVHQCLGQTLARVELQVVYGTLYRRVPTLRLAAPLERIPFKHDGFVYGVYELPVAW